MAITYSKLRNGNWGLRSDQALSANAIVTVTKKSGEFKSEQVGTLVWNGNGVWLYTIAIKAAPVRTAPPRRSRGWANSRRMSGWDGVVGSSSYYTSGQYDEDS